MTVTATSDESPDKSVRLTISKRDGAVMPLASEPSFATAPDGSVSMHSLNRTFVMSMRHDSIVVGFSDSVRAEVHEKMAESMKAESSGSGEQSALGDMIKGVVASSVTGAMREFFDKSRGFPLSSLRDISYESGEIRFDFIDKPKWDFTQVQTDGGTIMGQFHPADAARFVGAARARLKQR